MMDIVNFTLISAHIVVLISLLMLLNMSAFAIKKIKPKRSRSSRSITLPFPFAAKALNVNRERIKMPALQESDMQMFQKLLQPESDGDASHLSDIKKADFISFQDNLPFILIPPQSSSPLGVWRFHQSAPINKTWDKRITLRLAADLDSLTATKLLQRQEPRKANSPVYEHNHQTASMIAAAKGYQAIETLLARMDRMGKKSQQIS